MAKILLVDDDVELATNLQSFLKEKGVPVEMVHSGEDALQILSFSEFDVILLDWQMPGMSGLDVCKKYRSNKGTAFIFFLTGRGDIDSKEEALNAGGDDYLAKPYDPREVYARINSLTRRTLNVQSDVLTIDDVSLNVESRVVETNGHKLQLTPKEANLLEYLMRHPNRPFNAKRMASAVWPSDADASAETVRTWMNYLRKKLAGIGKENFIKTVVSAGYVIETNS